MGMESVYRLSVMLNMVDNLSGQMSSVQNNVSSSIGKINSAFGALQKAGAAMAGVGGAITGLTLKTVTSTFETQNALGELSSLGVENLKTVEAAAKSFSDTWAGTSKADFITASYDIKSGIASLTDEGVAQFTELAALTGKATKSTTEEMGSLFATGYGIYKGYYGELSDLEFGEMFSSGIATAVKNYKTSGSQMASSISALGATATNSNVPLEEQLAILGQLQTTMSGSEAATKYKSFLNQASSAGEKLGLTFLDTNNQLLSMPEILTELKGRYGDTIDAVEKRELKEAFGTDEAVALIDLLYNNVETLEGGIQDLHQSMKNGISVTEEMAEAINNTPEQKFQVLKQQIHNNVEELGNGLLPMVNETMDRISELIKRGSDWISNNQDTVQSIMDIAIKLGGFLMVIGTVLGTLGSLGKVLFLVKNAIGLVKTVTMGLNAAFLTSPIGWIVLGIAALIITFVKLWNESEAFRTFWINLFEQMKAAVLQAWSALQPALQNLGQKLIELYYAIQPILEIVGAVIGAILTYWLGLFIGTIQGVLAALTPLTNALSNLASFFTNVVNMIVALFKGDFSGACEFASAAVGNLKDFFINSFDAITSFLDGFATGFLDVIGGALSAIGIDADESITKMKNHIKTQLDTTKELFSSILGAASETVKEKLDNIKNAYEEHGGGVSGVIAAMGEGIKGYYTSGLSFIDNLTGGKLSSIKNKFDEKMSSIANTVSSKMAAAKNYASIQLSNMQAAYQASGGGIRGIVSATMTGVRGIFSSAYSAINTLTNGKLNSIKNAFTTKLNAAKQAVSNAIERIKACFNFTWSLPKLKLPHFSMSGSFSISPPSVPKFSVSWYKNGGILSSPTIFGAMGGSLLGGGEAGAEAVLPLSELWKQMKVIISEIVGIEDDRDGGSLQQAGASITNAITSKVTTFRKEKETSAKETYKTERWGKEGNTTINSITFTVDIQKIKDLPLLYKLIDELKDAQNRVDSPTPEAS